MATIEQKKAELEDVRAVRFISSALLEISASRMQELKDKLAENEQYYEEIGDVYVTLKQSAKRRNQEIQFASRKTKVLSVAFTTNKRFYGAVNQEVIKLFLSRVRGAQTDCIVVGETGRGIIENTKNAPTCQFHSFENDQPTVEEMQAFLRRTQPYERVYLYYPTFTSVFRQVVQTRDITYSDAMNDSASEEVDYIFEPELPLILDFFERRVRFLLFQRAMLETELARTAARFVAMTSAEQHSEEVSKKLSRTVTQLQNADANRKLIESLVGFLKWKEQ